MPWDSPPAESPPTTLVTPPEIFRTMPEVQGNAIDPWSGDVIEWEGSPEWTTHGPPTVPDLIEIDPADAGLRRSTRVTSKPTYHINYVVPVSPRDEFLDTMARLQQLDQSMPIYSVRLSKASAKLNAASKDGQDVQAHLIAAMEMAQTAQKDMDWRRALEDPVHRPNAIKALKDEVDSLEATILTRILPDDPEFADAVKYACPGRFLLDIKRSLAYKVRGVKQGFREDLEQTDGPGFNYYSSVVKLHSVRIVLMKRRPRGRALGIKDVSTAFLQSDPYPEGTIKYISFRDPITRVWHYYRQSGPIYGEVSAPKRWEDTIAPWFETMGFKRGDNERSCFYNAERDLLILLYVDDCLADGNAADVEWIFTA